MMKLINIILAVHCMLSCNGKDVITYKGIDLTSFDDNNIYTFGTSADYIHKFDGTVINERHKRQQDVTIDDHDYYMSQFISQEDQANALWFELDDNIIGSTGSPIFDENTSEAIILGQHRYYEMRDLMFSFPFYGHFVNTIAVTTGGFLYTGDIYHSQIHLTQYIAPLQADFNPSVSDNSTILIYNTADRFTVQWQDVHNHDHIDAGIFTFQVSLFPNGSIHFVYREIPLLVSLINDADHPVEVGLADAFYYVTNQGGYRFTQIYEYSRIELNAFDDLSYSAYIIDPLPNCVQGNNCTRCNELTTISSFQCSWCSHINWCSDGFDRNSQQWYDNGCANEAITSCDSMSTSTNTNTLSITYTTITTSSYGSTNTVFYSSAVSVPPPTTTTTASTPTVTVVQSSSSSSSSSMPVLASITVMLFLIVTAIVIISVIIFVLLYGYKHPNTRIGLFIIKHRPSAHWLNKTVKYKARTEKILLD